MRRLLSALFVALILAEVIVSPLVCERCCPTADQGHDQPDACSPWCVACTCCHLAHAVRPEVPQVPLVPTSLAEALEQVTPIGCMTPPREILHVPLV